MAAFTLNGSSTTPRDLLAGEDGIIGQNGALMILSGDAIDGTGSNNVFVAGSVIATSGRGIDLNNATSSYVLISSTGSILSFFDGVEIDLGSGFTQATFSNAGTVESTSDGVDMRGFDTTSTLRFVNSGTVSGQISGLRTGDAGNVDVINSGTLFGLNSAIRTDAGGAASVRIVNTGELIGGNGQALSSGLLSQTTLINSGQIEGALLFSVLADVYNGRFGTIEGDITGLSGDDTLRGGEGTEIMFGGADDDLLMGRGGDDELDGGSDFDTLMGGKGDDLLMGGGRPDELHGGKGDDTLSGGGGGDTFFFKRVTGEDRITDFQDGLDRIDLTDFDLQNFNALQGSGALSNDFNGVRIDLAAINGSGAILIDGIQVGDLSAADFVF